ncbi:MAG TPA: stalk domain-containing protein [Spirochaetia bacterium]|nr:stalk domain-containing protein [Spirochaetia bacterium]
MFKGGYVFWRVFAGIILLFSIMTYSWPVYADSPSSTGTATFTIGATIYSADNTRYVMDAAPFISDGRCFVPVRYLANALGVSDDNVDWDAGNQTITIISGSTTIALRLGSTTLTVNGNPEIMDVMPVVVNGRTMLPARWVSQALGARIGWNPRTGTILITGINGQSTVPVNNVGTQSPNQTSTGETIPALSYNSSVATNTRGFTWTYDGRIYNWTAAVPNDLLIYDEKINQLVDNFYSSDGNAQNQILAANSQDTDSLILANSASADGNFEPWVIEADNDAYIGSVAKWLSNQASLDGYDYFHAAEFAQSFVGGAMSYQVTNFPELPAETMFNNGDCKDKSILLAAILKAMGYNVALLYFPPPAGQTVGHEAVGVQFTDAQVTPSSQRNVNYYPYNGTKYYFAETTEPGWLIGQRSDQEPGYSGPSENSGYVYAVN